MKTKLKRAAVLIATISIAANVHSQDEGVEKDYLSPFNVIGSKEDVSTLKGSGYVLDNSDLDKFIHTDINDILRQVPGVYIRPEEGYGFFPNISLRGVDPKRSNKITILEDGIPSTPAPIADPAAYYAPTAGRMAGFEVLKGTSSLKYGPNTTGGVINYLSTPIPETQTSRIKGSYGSFNEKVAHAHSGGKLDFGSGKLGYLLEVYNHSSDGFKKITRINGAPEGGSPIQRSDLNLKLSYETGDGHYFEFKAGRMDMGADVSYQGVTLEDFKSNPYNRYLGTEHDNMDADQSRYYLRYMNEFSDSAKLTATVFRNEFNRNWYKLADVTNAGGSKVKVGKGVYSETNGTSLDHVGVLKGTLDGSYSVKSNDRSYISQGIALNFDYDLGNHDLDLGFRFMVDDYIQNSPYHQDVYEVNASAGTTTKKYVSKTGSDPYKDAESFEIYLVDDFKLGALSLSPGVRYTSIDYQYKGKWDRNLNELIFGIGAGYDLSDNFALFAGVHQGQTFPDAESASAENTGDGLKSQEKSLNFEIGTRGQIGSIGFDITYFNTQLDDMLFLKSAAAGIESSYNLGEGSTQGLEIALGTDIGSEGLGIPISMSATFTDTEFKTDGAFSYTGSSTGTKGKEFPYIPDTIFNIQGGLELTKARTYLNYFHQSDIYIDASNTTKLEDYGQLNWSGFYDLTESATIFAKATNLLDKTYAHGAAPDGYRAGAPRVWTLGMDFKF